MSDHAWILENLAAYLAGGLEPAERERLEQHTAECAPCAAALAESRGVDTALNALFAADRPGPALEDGIIQSLRARKDDGALRLPVPGWLAFAAAALLLIGVTGAVASQMLVQSGSPLSPSSPPNLFMHVSSVRVSPEDESEKGVDQLARVWREQVLGRLGTESDGRDLNQNNNDLGFYPPAQSLSVNGEATVRPRPKSQQSMTEVTPQGEAPQAQTPSPTPPAGGTPGFRGFVTNGGVPGGGMMGMAGGQGWGLNPYNYSYTGNPAAGYSVDGTSNTVRVPPDAYAPATSPALPGQPGQSRTPFAPSKFFDDAVVTKEKDKPGESRPTYQPPLGKDIGNGRAAIRDKEATFAEQDAKKVKEPPAPKAPDKPADQPGLRKIVIRTGEVEYEVSSFDAAVATITRLVKNIKGGFVATVNSDKLANGKVRGSVVVRVPPEALDGLLLDLRTDLSKGGELKNQRIGSQDITKQYTDLESRLKAGRAMEERLLKIIKDGKGEIKDLLAVEKELGNWRERIEQIEGELRYYANQVALSTLSITLIEKEIQAPYGTIETERVQMGLEVEEVDQALQAAQKAVREAKGRITKSELKQHSQGQFSAVLHFEVAPEEAGALRDRLKQLGTVTRLDIDRLEETQGGTGKPSDGKTKRHDTRFLVSFYNLTNVAPRETVTISLACVDVEAALKTLLARVDKATGRVLSSNLTRARSDQTGGTLQFEVKTPLADAVLDDVKKAGEVMRLQVTENPDAQNTTRKKRGFSVQLFAQESAVARETDEVQLACADVATSYRAVQEAVIKAKGRVRNAQLNEQDRKNVTASLDFDLRRDDEGALRAALATAGDVYTRKATRAPDGDNVLDSKVHWQIAFINQATIPPRETYVFGVEVADVDQTAAMLTALAGDRQGRTVEANVSRERSGRVTAKLVYDVPLAKAHELIDQLRSAGTVRVQQSVKHPEIPDSPLAIARLDVTLSNKELIVPSDEGIGTSVRGGLADSVRMLGWSLRILIFGLCIVLPWALVIWAIYRLVVRLRRRSAPATPAA